MKEEKSRVKERKREEKRGENKGAEGTEAEREMQS